MDMSIRFPGLKLVLDYVPKSFEIFGFEITIYGVCLLYTSDAADE